MNHPELDSFDIVDENHEILGNKDSCPVYCKNNSITLSL